MGWITCCLATRMPHAHLAPHELTASQVEAAFRTAGLQPLAAPDRIAAVVGNQLRLFAPEAARLTLGDEPAQFLCRQDPEAT